MSDKDKLNELIKDIQAVIDYPKEGHPRRTKDGYPAEIKYDKYAYYRIVDSYREGLAEIVEHYKEAKDDKNQAI